MKEPRSLFGFRSSSPSATTAASPAAAPVAASVSPSAVAASSLHAAPANPPAAHASPLPNSPSHAPTSAAGQAAGGAAGAQAQQQIPTIRFIPYITDSHKGLNFPILERKVPNGKVLKVKRFVEKGNTDMSDCISFKSKVVSRQHGEVFTEGMTFFYRDTKSSSGSFINNVRASAANVESAPIALKDGDVIQLGVDYQGRTEDIFRCVRMRVEINREAFKTRNNAFRNQVIKALRALAAANDKDSQGTGDCCICLGAIAPFQALFIAPCCHSFHFKCARPLLNTWPNFSCPLCRHFADLSVSVSVDDLAALIDGAVLDDNNDKGAASPKAMHDHSGRSSNAGLADNEHQRHLAPDTTRPITSGPSIGPTPVVSVVADSADEGDANVTQGLLVPNEEGAAGTSMVTVRSDHENGSDPHSLNSDGAAIEPEHEAPLGGSGLAPATNADPDLEESEHREPHERTAASPGTVTNSPARPGSMPSPPPMPPVVLPAARSNDQMFDADAAPRLSKDGSAAASTGMSDAGASPPMPVTSSSAYAPGTGM